MLACPSRVGFRYTNQVESWWKPIWGSVLDCGSKNTEGGEEEKGERGTPPAKKKSSNKVTVGKKQPAAVAEKGGGRAKRGSAKLEPAVVEEAPVVEVPSSVPQLKELKQIRFPECVTHKP